VTILLTYMASKYCNDSSWTMAHIICHSLHKVWIMTTANKGNVLKTLDRVAKYRPIVHVIGDV
jgi:hypothetical protein